MEAKKKQKIAWPSQIGESVGNAYGYQHHNRMMRLHVGRHVDYDDDAQMVVQIVPADKFVPFPGKFNVLFTMWEFLDLPESYIEAINRADLILVPCSFCKDLFKRYTTKPVEVVYEGVDPGIYRYHERKPTVPFRFLWVGAPNPRKGYQLILEAVKIFEQMAGVEIYIKTTVPKMNWIQTIRAVWKKRKEIFSNPDRKASFWRMLGRIPRPQLADKITRYGKHKNIVFDTRKLPIDELIGLYNSAHCFVLPSFGEGWGLTLSEAMATGAPCVATKHTGTEDFFDEKVGYVIEHETRLMELQNYRLTTKGFVPDTNSMVQKMIEVMRNYPAALKKGRAASTRITNNFTWENAANRMQEILRRYEPCLYQKPT